MNDWFAMMNWINATRTELNTAAVIHVGDIIEWPRAKDWENARKGLLLLLALWVVAFGNHDDNRWNGNTDVAQGGDLRNANKYLPYAEEAAKPSFVASFPDRKVDNTAHQFIAGGRKWLVVSLNFVPSGEEMAWANQIIAAHPEYLVIVNTHDYMASSVRSAAGEALWNAVVRKHPNMFMVLCGHIPTAARRSDKGDHGNTVHQILADYQHYSLREPNSYLRVMRLDPAAGTIRVRTYSPAFNKYMTDRANDFTITGVDFTVRKKA